MKENEKITRISLIEAKKQRGKSNLAKLMSEQRKESDKPSIPTNKTRR